MNDDSHHDGMTANDIDWSAVEIEPPEPPGWLGKMTAIWLLCGVFAVGNTLFLCLLPNFLLTSIPFMAIGLFTLAAALRMFERRVGSITTSGVTAIVFGLVMMSVPLLMLFESFHWICILGANLFAIPAMSMIGSGWWILSRRSEYQNWIDAGKRCRTVELAAHEVILSEATERGVTLPEGEMHAFSVVPGSLFAKYPQPLNWIALARTGPDGIRTAWQLPTIVGDHDDFPSERLQRTMILTFAQGTDPVFLDGETLTIQRYHVNERRFETIAGSLFEWLNGVGRA